MKLRKSLSGHGPSEGGCGAAELADAVRAIETAIDNGMTTIDTASVYGFGLSENLSVKL